MNLLVLILEILFTVFMLSILGLYIFWLLLTWSWAQHQTKNDAGQSPRWKDVLSMASIEWGAVLTLVATHLQRVHFVYRAPPLRFEDETRRQWPIVFVPSLHTGRGLFAIPIWRLKKNFYSSLWPFTWKSFLNSSSLLEDELAHYLTDLIQKTEAPYFRMISFGSSYPIVARVLERPEIKKHCRQWIGISAPSQMSSTMTFLSSKRLREAYQNTDLPRFPDLLIRGSNDSVCYPDDVWKAEREVVISPVGHYSVLLHSTCVRTLLDEMSQ